MRVLFVTNMWPDQERPWYGSFVYSQARSLRERGVAVDVLAIRGYVSNWKYLDAAADMVKRSLGSRHDLVHAHYGHSAVIGRLDLRHPLVVSYCGDDLLGTPARGNPAHMTRRSRLLAAAFGQVARVASATITKSLQMSLALPVGVRHRNHVIPNGVDLEMFKRSDQVAARSQLGWDPDEKVALFAGNPSNERKNHALAVSAVELAARSCPSLRLRVATNVAPAQMPLWMSAANVLVHPSWSEGSPNVVKEAMACELPIVATPVGDVPERLGGLAGCHVVPPVPEEFARSMLEALDHHPCPAARQSVSELSLERVALRVEALYEQVIAQRRRRGGPARTRWGG